MTDHELRARLGDVLLAIREALASEARPSEAGLRYLRELRNEAAVLGAEVERREVAA